MCLFSLRNLISKIYMGYFMDSSLIINQLNILLRSLWIFTFFAVVFSNEGMVKETGRSS